MQECLQSSYKRGDFNYVSNQGLRHLKELIALVENSNETVRCANFQFAGRSRPIEQHLFVISEYMKQMMAENTFGR